MTAEAGVVNAPSPAAAGGWAADAVTSGVVLAGDASEASDASEDSDALGAADAAGHADVSVVDAAVVAVAELDGVACVKALAASRAAVVAAEATQVALVAAWADICNGDTLTDTGIGSSIDGLGFHGDGDGNGVGSGIGFSGGVGVGVGVGGGSVLAGLERVVCPGGDGTPGVWEFAAAELGVVLEMTTTAASGLLRDVLDLRHRHPRLWGLVLAGRARFWQARQISRMVHHAGLDLAGARYVDERTGRHLGSVPWGRMLGLVDAAVIEADPEAAERRRLEKAMERFVRSGQSNEHGLKTLYAQVEAGHAIAFVAMCDRIAQILAATGDPDPIEVLRAKAIGWLGTPLRAAALLHQAEHRTRTTTDTTDNADADSADGTDSTDTTNGSDGSDGPDDVGIDGIDVGIDVGTIGIDVEPWTKR